jgi:DNA-binding PadR family transcriptional regulator
MMTSMGSRANPPRRSALGLVVLLNLLEGPTHVYRLQKLIEETGKDRVVNVRSRASLYQTIERLERHGLVEVSKTVRTPGYPDRVEYAITDRGREVAREWLREMLNATGDEYPEFVAAVSMIFALEPADARAQLELREQRLAEELREVEAGLSGANVPAGLPRLFLLEEEYRRMVLEAELAWIGDVISDLRDGRLSWSREWLREMSAQFLPDDERDVPTAG